jgi:hypothetical protein
VVRSRRLGDVCTILAQSPEPIAEEPADERSRRETEHDRHCCRGEISETLGLGEGDGNQTYPDSQTHPRHGTNDDSNCRVHPAPTLPHGRYTASAPLTSPSVMVTSMAIGVPGGMP